MMELATVKKHLRVIDDFEDDVIQMYMGWAQQKVKSSVTDEPIMYDLFFDQNPHYDRAVILLTAHYFNNRLPLADKPQYNLAFGLNDALSHMRADFLRYEEEMNADE